MSVKAQVVLTALLVLVGHSSCVGAAVVQHLDASNAGNVTVAQGSNTVVRVRDLSGNGRDALEGRGGVLFPSASRSQSGLRGLDMGADRNDLIALDQGAAESFLNFQGAAAGNEGFSFAVAFKVDSLTGSDQFVLGTSHLRLHVKVGSDNRLGVRLTTSTRSLGDYHVRAGDTVVLTVAYSAENGAYALWDSKNQEAVTGSVDPNIDAQNDSPLRLGEARTTGSSSNFLRGMIGEFLLYDTPLSPGELWRLQQDLTEKWTGVRPQLTPVAPGPGFRNINRPAGDIGSVYYSSQFVDNDRKARTVEMGFLNGFLFMNTRGDSLGKFSIWDVSNEASPVRVRSIDIGGQMHTGVVFIPADDPTGTVYYYNNNSFVNMRDPANPVTEKPAGYRTGRAGARGLSVLPYEFSSGNAAVTISDARSGTEIAKVSEHGFAGTPTPLGNLLLVSGLRGQARGIAVYDMANPASPELLDVIPPDRTLWSGEGNPGYEYSVWKHYFVLPNAINDRDAGFVSFEDPTYLKINAFIRGLPGATRYAQYQDDYMFVGHGKYLMTPLDSGGEPQRVALFDRQDAEYMLPLGNLIASAENSEQGRDNGFTVYAHQAPRDTTPPRVYFHSPAAGARYQHVKSRIGVVIHDTLDISTVNASTFRVFPKNAGGADVLGTRNVHDKDILTFTPNADLLPSTTYTVRLDGIADVAGNFIAPYTFDFTTSGPGDPPSVRIDGITASAYPAVPGASVSFNATASGGAGALQYRWDFGDGSERTRWSSVASVTHAFADEGHYTVKVQVRDGSGRYAKTRTVVITAIDTSQLAATKPAFSSQMHVDESGRRVWVANPDSNTVTAINADTLAKVAEFPVCKDPRSVGLDGSGRLWVTCIDADRVRLLNASTGQTIRDIALHPGSRPHDLLFDRNRSFAFVSLEASGQIARIATASFAVDLVEAGRTPTAMAMPSVGSKLYVNEFISPDQQGQVRQFNRGNNLRLDRTIGLQKDTTSEEEGDSGRGLPNYLSSIVVSPDNRFAYVASKQDNIDRGEFRNRSDLTFETTSRSIVSKIDLATGLEVFAERVDIDNSSQPSALLFSPLGDYLFIALQGSNAVAVFDMFDGNLVTQLETGLAPQALAFDPATSRLFVNNLNSRSVTVFDIADALRLGFGEGIASTDVSTVAVELMSPAVLRGKQVFYNAADPRMSQDVYMSCALCHQDGGHDGRTWDFTDRGEGLRNTTSLRGRAGMGHGRVHWSGNFNEIQDFEIDIRRAFGGTGFITNAAGNALAVNASLGNPNGGRNGDLDALATYAASLGRDSIESSPFKNPDGTLTAQGQLGKVWFESLACVGCHNPASDYTDSASGVLHNVGTIRASSGERLGQALTGIDTPGLLGVHATAPYFHDGRAATLEALFDPSGDTNRSGELNKQHDLTRTHGLRPDEAAALIAYLKQLDANTAALARAGFFHSGFESP